MALSCTSSKGSSVDPFTFSFAALPGAKKNITGYAEVCRAVNHEASQLYVRTSAAGAGDYGYNTFTVVESNNAGSQIHRNFGVDGDCCSGKLGGLVS